MTSRRFDWALALGLITSAAVMPAEPAGPAVPPSPGVRNGHRMAYDAGTGELLMFGGADDARVRDDLWAWNGARRSWRRLSAGGPGPRTFPGFAFDRRRREAVLFGGNRVLFGRPGELDTLLADTWIWRDGRWSRRHVAGPPARSEPAMDDDSARGRVVLFGGYQPSPDGNVRLGDTWEWDGGRWSLVARDGPAARSGAAMAYDDRRRRMVLFGGRTPPALSGETWEWDGARWARVADGDAEPRFNPVMAFDRHAGTLVRFGGWTGAVRTADTWLFRWPRWERVEAPGPSARNHSAMAYDDRRRRMVLFGGHDGGDVFGDAWEWDGRGWTRVGDVRPRPRVENSH
jgi:Galactose oxidase, central domain